MRRFSNFEARWSILVLRTLVFPSKWLVKISQASLADSHPWMILNWSRSTEEKMAVRALELNLEAAFSGSVHWFFGFGARVLSSVIIVGTDHPSSTAVHASSSIPLINCRILAFQWPKLQLSSIMGLWIPNSSFMVSMKSAGSQPVSSVWYHRGFPLWYQMKVQGLPNIRTKTQDTKNTFLYIRNLLNNLPRSV